MKTLGMIAGNRKFPLIFAQEARKCGVERLVAVAFEGETDPRIEEVVDKVVWMKLGQLGRLIEAFLEEEVRDVVMVGQIAPRNLFSSVRLDLRMTMLLAKLKHRNAETIFGAVGTELEKDGIRLLPHADYLKRLIPAPGVLTRRKPNAQERKDLEFGFKTAKQIAKLDIGQTVVVKQGTILAVEAFEGTDLALQRGGGLGQGGAVAVKVTKPGQDMRFDIPCVGPSTIDVLIKSSITTLGIEARRTLLLEMDEMITQADQADIAIEALEYT